MNPAHIHAAHMNSRPLQGVWITTKGVNAAASCTSAPQIWIPDADRSRKSKTEEPIRGKGDHAHQLASQPGIEWCGQVPPGALNHTTAAGTQPNCTVAVAR